MAEFSLCLEAVSFQRLELRESGPYGGVQYLWFSGLPMRREEGGWKELSLDSPEFQWIASLILKGWNKSPAHLLAEMTELILAGRYPEGLELKPWLTWVAGDIRLGYELI